jgi:hypothetical protein
MELHVGDRVELKKQHPCGCKQFEIMRVGMDCRLKCLGCGAVICLLRRELERRVRKRLDTDT